MIRQIILRNFQGHTLLRLKLDPHITTIIGPSDVGKSSIFRALQWVVFNRPSGDAFIQDGKTKTTVSIITDKGTVKRLKGKVNEYQVDGVVLKAFGSDVPDQVTEVLRMSSINFQSQHEGSFWFSRTPGEVSRHLNEIVDLGIMDRSLAYLFSSLRKVRTEVDVAKDRLGEARQTRQDLHYVIGLDRELTKVEAAQEVLDVCLRGRDRLSELIDQAEEFEKTAGREIPDIAPLENLGRAAAAARRNSIKLNTILVEIEKLQSIEEGSTQFAISEESRLKRLIGNTCPLCDQPIKKRMLTGGAK